MINSNSSEIETPSIEPPANPNTEYLSLTVSTYTHNYLLAKEIAGSSPVFHPKHTSIQGLQFKHYHPYTGSHAHSFYEFQHL